MLGKKPVGTGHGDGRWWEEKQLVHLLEKEYVGVEVDDTVVLNQTKGVQLGGTRIPRGGRGFWFPTGVISKDMAFEREGLVAHPDLA